MCIENCVKGDWPDSGYGYKVVIKVTKKSWKKPRYFGLFRTHTITLERRKPYTTERFQKRYFADIPGDDAFNNQNGFHIFKHFQDGLKTLEYFKTDPELYHLKNKLRLQRERFKGSEAEFVLIRVEYKSLIHEGIFPSYCIGGLDQPCFTAKFMKVVEEYKEV